MIGVELETIIMRVSLAEFRSRPVRGGIDLDNVLDIAIDSIQAGR
ncbi:hypothetical protein [Nocardia sp. NPDC003963]